MVNLFSSKSSDTQKTASFQCQVYVTQLLEIPFHIPNAYIKVKYKYRNRVHRFQSGLMNICGGLEAKPSHGTGITNAHDSRNTSSASVGAFESVRSAKVKNATSTKQNNHHQQSTPSYYIYQIPLPPSIALNIHSNSHVLESFHIHCKLRSRNSKKALKKIGEVTIDLSQFANNKESINRRYLLHKCKMNALMSFNVSMNQVSGDKLFRCPSELPSNKKSKSSDVSMKSERSFDFDAFSPTRAVRSPGVNRSQNDSASLVDNIISESLTSSAKEDDDKTDTVVDSTNYASAERQLSFESADDEAEENLSPSAMSPPMYDSLLNVDE